MWFYLHVRLQPTNICLLFTDSAIYCLGTLFTSAEAQAAEITSSDKTFLVTLITTSVSSPSIRILPCFIPNFLSLLH